MRGPGRGGGDILPKMTEHPEPGVHHAKIGALGIEPPPDPLIELFCAINIRDGDNNNLKLHATPPALRFAATDFTSTAWLPPGLFLHDVWNAYQSNVF